MGCFIPYRRQGWEDWTAVRNLNPLTCDVFGDNSCIGYWPLDKVATSSDALDCNDYCSLHPVVNTSPDELYACPAGFIKQCFKYDMSSDESYVIMASGFSPYALPVTHTFWGRVNSSDDVTTRITGLSGQPSWAMFVDLSAVQGFTALAFDYNTYTLHQVVVPIENPKEWHFLCTILEQAKLTVFVFDINGELVGTQQTTFNSFTSAQLVDEQPVFSFSSGGSGFVYVDNIRLFRRILTEEELQKLCIQDRLFPINPSDCDFFGDGSCIGYWKFDDVSPNDFDDACHRHPTVVNDGYPEANPDGIIGGCVGCSDGDPWTYRAEEFSAHLPITKTWWMRSTMNVSFACGETSSPAGPEGWTFRSWLKPTENEYGVQVWYTPYDSVFISVPLNNPEEWHFFCDIYEEDKVTIVVFDVDGNIIAQKTETFQALAEDVLDDIQFFVEVDRNEAAEGETWIDNLRMFNRILSLDELHQLCVEDRGSSEEGEEGGGGR